MVILVIYWLFLCISLMDYDSKAAKEAMQKSSTAFFFLFFLFQIQIKDIPKLRNKHLLRACQMGEIVKMFLYKLKNRAHFCS